MAQAPGAKDGNALLQCSRRVFSRLEKDLTAQALAEEIFVVATDPGCPDMRLLDAQLKELHASKSGSGEDDFRRFLLNRVQGEYERLFERRRKRTDPSTSAGPRHHAGQLLKLICSLHRSRLLATAVLLKCALDLVRGAPAKQTLAAGARQGFVRQMIWQIPRLGPDHLDVARKLDACLSRQQPSMAEARARLQMHISDCEALAASSPASSCSQGKIR